MNDPIDSCLRDLPYSGKLAPGNYLKVAAYQNQLMYSLLEERTFELKLMPRYDGLFNLNPARAEMMYFPVFYGNESIKKIKIGD